MPTATEFIEKWPLYTRAEITAFTAPTSITRLCTGPHCGKETTWIRDELKTVQTSDITFYSAVYKCGLCNHNVLIVLYRLLDWTNPVNKQAFYGAVHKIGQVPAQSIEIPGALEQRLGSTAAYYKEAVICRSHNFGIGAVAYMRRVIEDKTDELIDVVVELAGTYGVTKQVIERLGAAKQQIQFEEKVKVASEVIPDSLRPGGVNPLGQLHKHLSVGVHGKTDDQCIAIFDDLQADFEFVFRNLYIQAREAKEFAQRVQRRSGKIG